MPPENGGAIVAELVVGLQRVLPREKIRPKLGAGIIEGDLHGDVGHASRHCRVKVVRKVGMAIAKRVGDMAEGQIRTRNGRVGIILVDDRGKDHTAKASCSIVIVVGKAREYMRAASRVPIETPRTQPLEIRSGHNPGELLERGWRSQNCRVVLAGLFEVEEPEHAVLDHGAAEAEPALHTVEGRVGRADTSGEVVVAPVHEAAAVQLVRSGTRDDIDRTGVRQTRGRVQCELADLKSLESIQRVVLQGGAYDLVRDVDSIHLNAGSAPFPTGD